MDYLFKNYVCAPLFNRFRLVVTGFLSKYGGEFVTCQIPTPIKKWGVVFVRSTDFFRFWCELKYFLVVAMLTKELWEHIGDFHFEIYIFFTFK